MKKIILVLALAALAAGTARAQQWVQKKIADFAVAEFPFAPKEQKDNNEVRYTCKTKTEYYQVYNEDLSSTLTLEFSPKALDMFYAANMDEIQKSTTATSVTDSAFYINGLKGVQVQLQYDSTNTRQFYGRIILVNKHLITQIYSSTDKDAGQSAANRLKFFEGLAFTVNKSALKQTTLTDAPADMSSDKSASNGAFEAGRVVGMMIVPALLLALVGWGLYKLIKRASAAKS